MHERHAGLLKEIVPEHDFGEVHAMRLFAPPEGALGVVKLVGLGEMPLVRVLVAVIHPCLRGGDEGHAEPVLAAPVSRQRWAASHLAFACSTSRPSPTSPSCPQKTCWRHRSCGWS